MRWELMTKVENKEDLWGDGIAKHQVLEHIHVGNENKMSYSKIML